MQIFKSYFVRALRLLCIAVFLNLGSRTAASKLFSFEGWLFAWILAVQTVLLPVIFDYPHMVLGNSNKAVGTSSKLSEN